jgi:hypothetical protein
VAEKIYASTGHSEEVVFGWISLFIKHVESLIQARSMLDHQVSESSIISEMGWSKTQSNKMIPQIKGQSTKHLVYAYQELLELQKNIIYETDRFQKFVFWVMNSQSSGT